LSAAVERSEAPAAENFGYGLGPAEHGRMHLPQSADSGVPRPSAVGGEFDLQDFYRPFTLDEITPENMQSWPYYRHVSAHWDEYVTTSTEEIIPAPNPVGLDPDGGFDLNGEFRAGKSYLQSLIETQAKGFVVLKDNNILAEFYANGFNVGEANLLQSAAKTFAGVVTHRLLDEGALSADATVDSVLPGFGETTIGGATVQQVLDMTSGAPTLLDFHTPGTLAYQWEVEIGLKGGQTCGHLAAIKAAPKVAAPGAAWNYTDMNTDTLALLGEHVTQRSYVELLSELFADFGATAPGSIAVASDGVASPCYGISTTTRDYALFHQWLAERNGPESYYESAMDVSKDQITTTNELGAKAFPGTTYGSQTYFIERENVLHSSGSFGQLGFSDMDAGIAIATHQDWANNAELAKFEESRSRATAIIKALR
jgi:CubicO group peptidase (beta-lactamase class C family)